MMGRRQVRLRAAARRDVAVMRDRIWSEGWTAGMAGERPNNPYSADDPRGRLWADACRAGANAARSMARERSRPTPPARTTPGERRQSLAKVAGTLCSNPAFQAWLGVTDHEEAAAWVRRVCGIQSRRELDTNPEAERRFHDRVRRPFAGSRES